MTRPRFIQLHTLVSYSAALLKGDSLSDAERDAVAQKLHEYTGLSTEYIKKANLRVREPQFTQELLREHHEGDIPPPGEVRPARAAASGRSVKHPSSAR